MEIDSSNEQPLNAKSPICSRVPSASNCTSVKAAQFLNAFSPIATVSLATMTLVRAVPLNKSLART